MRVNKKKRQAYRPSDHVVSRESAVSSILGAIGIFGYLILVGASFQAAGNGGIPVSYTHLTLPTNRQGEYCSAQLCGCCLASLSLE